MEAFWGDVHTRLCYLSSTLLNEQLPADLVSSVEEYTLIGTTPTPERVWPDVAVQEPEEPDAGGVATAPAAVEATFVLQIRPGATKLKRVRIEEADTGRLITVLEWLSPANKRGDGLRAYRRKRRGLLERGVNLVEIDLIRRGHWQRLYRRFEFGPEHDTPYRVAIQFAAEPDQLYLTPIPLRQPLPKVVVPLRANDPRVALPLGNLLSDAYASGRYARRIDYAQPPVPRLAEVDAAWAEGMLRAARLR